MQIPEVSIDPGLQDFSGVGQVQLINIRNEARPITVLEDGLHTFTISPAEWSEDFIQSLARELKRRNVFAAPEGNACSIAVDLEPREGGQAGPPRLKVNVRVKDWQGIYPKKEPTENLHGGGVNRGPQGGPGGVNNSTRILKDRIASSLKATLFVSMMELLADPEFQRAIAWR